MIGIFNISHHILYIYYEFKSGNTHCFSCGMKATPLCLTSCLLSLSDLRCICGRSLPRYDRCFLHRGRSFTKTNLFCKKW